MTTYIASIELKALPGSEMYESGSGTGGFVHCLILADSVESARSILMKNLEEDKYELLDLDFFEEFDNMEWENEEQEEEFQSYADDLSADENFVYSEFYTYENLDS